MYEPRIDRIYGERLYLGLSVPGSKVTEGMIMYSCIRVCRRQFLLFFHPPHLFVFFPLKCMWGLFLFPVFKMSFLCHKSEIPFQTLTLELFFPNFYFSGQSFFFLSLFSVRIFWKDKHHRPENKWRLAANRGFKGRKKQIVWGKGLKRIVFPVSLTFWVTANGAY